MKITVNCRYGLSFSVDTKFYDIRYEENWVHLIPIDPNLREYAIPIHNIDSIIYDPY